MPHNALSWHFFLPYRSFVYILLFQILGSYEISVCENCVFLHLCSSDFSLTLFFFLSDLSSSSFILSYFRFLFVLL